MEQTNRYLDFNAAIAGYDGQAGSNGVNAVPPVNTIPQPGPQGANGGPGSTGTAATPASNGLNGDNIYALPVLAQGTNGANGAVGPASIAALAGVAPIFTPTYTLGSATISAGGVTVFTPGSSSGVTYAASRWTLPVAGYYEISMVGTAPIMALNILPSTGPNVLLPARTNMFSSNYGAWFTAGTTIGISTVSGVLNVSFSIVKLG